METDHVPTAPLETRFVVDLGISVSADVTSAILDHQTRSASVHLSSHDDARSAAH